jgi:hypothetical protein
MKVTRYLGPLQLHISLANVQVTGSGFCKMSPSAVSKKALLSGDDDSA